MKWLSWFHFFIWFHFLILEEGLLVILMDCIIFLSPFLHLTRMIMSTVSYLKQIDCGILCLEYFPLTYGLNGFKCRINRHLFISTFCWRICLKISLIHFMALGSPYASWNATENLRFPNIFRGHWRDQCHEMRQKWFFLQLPILLLRPWSHLFLNLRLTAYIHGNTVLSEYYIWLVK